MQTDRGTIEKAEERNHIYMYNEIRQSRKRKKGIGKCISGR